MKAPLQSIADASGAALDLAKGSQHDDGSLSVEHEKGQWIPQEVGHGVDDALPHGRQLRGLGRRREGSGHHDVRIAIAKSEQISARLHVNSVSRT